MSTHPHVRIGPDFAFTGPDGDYTIAGHGGHFRVSGAGSNITRIDGDWPTTPGDYPLAPYQPGAAPPTGDTGHPAPAPAAKPARKQATPRKTASKTKRKAGKGT